MKLCYALLYYDPLKVDDDPRAYLARVRSAHDLPQALAQRGHEVMVVHLYPFDAEVRAEQVRHCFVAPGALARAIGAALAFRRPRSRARFTPAGRAIASILGARPDVVHFFGTSLHLNLALLIRRRNGDAPPVVLHYHGGEPAQWWATRRLQRYGFAAGARVLFTTDEQAAAHRRAGLLRDAFPQAAKLVETSSRFRPTPRAEARARTGMQGDPVFLWAARLDPLKDPLTALRGFARIAEQRPGARLYVHYLADGMLAQLQGTVRDDPRLAGRVHFGGTLPYERMEAVYNSADFLLQASVREHSGCAVLDAMACGTIPVVTDIPSFRAMTGDGEVGVIFPPGDDSALARRVLEITPAGLADASSAVRSRFEQHLSYGAIAEQLESTYEEVLAC